jgi:hypothetical protein
MKQAKKILWSVCLPALFFFPVVVYSQDDRNFNSLASESSGMVGPAEFAECLTGFNTWDADFSNFLNTDEFYRVKFSILDTDGNGVIDGDELERLSKYEAFYDTTRSMSETGSMDMQTGRSASQSDMQTNGSDMGTSENTGMHSGGTDMHAGSGTSYPDTARHSGMSGGDVAMQMKMPWDFNQDGEVTYDEFVNAVNALNVYNAWDTDQDGQINESEMANALFNVWDADNNGFIDENEFAGYDQVCEPELTLSD